MRTILIEVDYSCQMAKVSLDDKCVMEGNYWDFTPYCMGIHTYGDFNSYRSLSTKIYQYLIKSEGEDFRNISTKLINYVWEY
jgi:hypothetical protein